jgi:hypothetical protein
MSMYRDEERAMEVLWEEFQEAVDDANWQVAVEKLQLAHYLEFEGMAAQMEAALQAVNYGEVSN